MISTILCIAAAAACGNDETVPVETPTDSAGVLLVPSIPGQATALRLDQRLVVIGEDDAEAHQLYRVGAARLDEDWSILVADGGSREIRRYGSDGAFLETIGGPGEGPGEFGMLSGFWMPSPDEIAVVDPRLDRITVFGLDGGVRETRRIDQRGAVEPQLNQVLFPGGALGLTRDGHVIGFDAILFTQEGSAGLRPIGGPLTVSRPDGVDTLAHVVMMNAYETPGGDRPFVMVPAMGRLVWDLRDTRLALSEGTAHDITLIDDGVVTARLREDRRRAVAPADSTSPVPIDSLPAYRQLTVDAGRRIWAAPGAVADATEAVWRRFSAEGALEAEIQGLRARDRVLDARGNQLLLLRFDDLDVETVELWTLTPAEGDGGG